MPLGDGITFSYGDHVFDPRPLFTVNKEMIKTPANTGLATKYSLTLNGHVLPSLIHKCYLAKQNNTDLNVWGTGKALREFIYSEDVGRLTEWVLDNYEEDEPIIFSPSKEITIRYMVELIVENLNFKGNVVFDTSKPEGQFRKPSDNSKLKSYLPDFEFTPIEEGIKKTVDWFMDNYGTIRK